MEYELTNERPQELERRVVELEARVRDLVTLIDRWRANGLSVLDSGPWFAGSGGTYGTSTQVARADHT